MMMLLFVDQFNNFFLIMLILIEFNVKDRVPSSIFNSQARKYREANGFELATPVFDQ
jgi:hypothetical protein